MTTKKMFIALLLTAVILGTSCISLAETNKKPSALSTVWRSNPAYANRLSAPAKVYKFYINPPTGYVLEYKQSQNPNVITDEYKWRGPVGPDGTKPSLSIAIYKVRPGSVNTASAEEHLNIGLDGLSSDSRHYIHTDIQSGTISGVSFVRAYWKRDPNDANVGKRFHGFQYFYSSDGVFLTILGEDVEPHYKSTLDLLEASALTFRK